MISPLDWVSGELAALEGANLRRRRREVTPLPEGKCSLEGRTLWNFSGNDTLGLAGDPRLAEAAAEALRDCGSGARASALVTGRTPWHARLEERLARFKGTEAAILFPTGYAANVGTIGALVGPPDVVFCDRLNHASLIDGCRLSRARFQVYSRGNATLETSAETSEPPPQVQQPSLSGDVPLAALAAVLKKGGAARRRLIVTDSLFSMDGDAAPLAELVQLTEQYNAMLLVDEAHATGVFGRRGTGLVEMLVSPSSSALVAVGTLSKAVGAQGGFVTGSRELIDWLWNSARTQMFSTALSPAACAAAARAIDIIEEEPERRTWLAAAAARVQQELREMGWNVPRNVAGPIIPVLVGDPPSTLTLASELERQGLLIIPIRPPTVPHGTSRLRISLSHAHGEEGIAALLNGFQDVRRSLTGQR